MIDDAEYVMLEWVDRFNHRRLLEPIGNLPPAVVQIINLVQEKLK